jgi:hypothetical protein
MPRTHRTHTSILPLAQRHRSPRYHLRTSNIATEYHVRVPRPARGRSVRSRVEAPSPVAAAGLACAGGAFEAEPEPDAIRRVHVGCDAQTAVAGASSHLANAKKPAAPVPVPAAMHAPFPSGPNYSPSSPSFPSSCPRADDSRTRWMLAGRGKRKRFGLPRPLDAA